MTDDQLRDLAQRYRDMMGSGLEWDAKLEMAYRSATLPTPFMRLLDRLRTAERERDEAYERAAQECDKLILMDDVIGAAQAIRALKGAQ